MNGPSIEGSEEGTYRFACYLCGGSFETTVTRTFTSSRDHSGDLLRTAVQEAQSEGWDINLKRSRSMCKGCQDKTGREA
jgi:hypothetical protein